MHSFFEDVRLGLRNLARRPGLTIVAVAALALGIGPNSAIFTVVNAVLLQPLKFPESSRLYTIQNGARDRPFDPAFGAMSDRQVAEFERQAQSFEGVAASSFRPMGLSGAGEAIAVMAYEITPNFWTVMRATPALGRAFLEEDGRAGHEQVALLSEQLWRGHFRGDPSVAGKRIRLDGKDYTVAGVMPARARYPATADLWIPMVLAPSARGNFFRQVVGRVKPLVRREQAQAEVETIAARLRAPSDRQSMVRAIPLRDFVVAGVRESLLVFLGAVGFILLIACTNVANLLLARAQGRRQEMAVRAAVGARRSRLVRQLLTESCLLGLAGGVTGILAAAWGTDLLVGLAPADLIPRTGEIHVDGWVLGFTLLLSLATGVLFGLAPALSLSRTDLQYSLKRGGRVSTQSGGQNASGPLSRGALVICEIALALVLLVGAGLMIKSFVRLRAVDPGFRPARVLTALVELNGDEYRTVDQLRGFHERTLERLAGIPGVTAAAAVNWLPLAGMSIQGDFRLEQQPARTRPFIALKPAVTPEYFRAMGIRILAGRAFEPHDDSRAPGVAIVSQGFVRRTGIADPIGKRLTMEDDPKPEDWLTIVGVVDDVKHFGLAMNAAPAIYQPVAQVRSAFFLSHMTYLVQTAAEPHSVASALRAQVRGLDPDQPIRALVSMDDLLAASTADPRFRSQLLGGFSGIALLLAVVGIYGVMAYSVSERTLEIGIRVALGARSADVWRIVLGRSALLALAGIGIGLAGAWGATRVLKSFLFAVTPTDAATYAAVSLLLGAVALAASLIPAWRATKVDPVVALHWE